MTERFCFPAGLNLQSGTYSREEGNLWGLWILLLDIFKLLAKKFYCILRTIKFKSDKIIVLYRLQGSVIYL